MNVTKPFRNKKLEFKQSKFLNTLNWHKNYWDCLIDERNYNSNNCNWMLIDLNSLKHNLYKYKKSKFTNFKK